MEETKGCRNRPRYLGLVIFKKGTLVGTKKKVVFNDCCWNNRISVSILKNILALLSHFKVNSKYSIYLNAKAKMPENIGKNLWDFREGKYFLEYKKHEL